MTKLLPHGIDLARFALPLIIAQLVSSSMTTAADNVAKQDEHHDNVVRQLLTEHGLTKQHFLASKDKLIPIYDVKQNVARIRQDQVNAYLGKVDSPKPILVSEPSSPGGIRGLFSNVYNMLPSIPFYSTSSSKPTAPILNTTEEKSKTGADAQSSSQQPTSVPEVNSNRSSSVSLSTPDIDPSLVPESLGVSRNSESAPPQLIFSFPGGGFLTLPQAIFVNYLERKINRPLRDVAFALVGTSAGGLNCLSLAIDGIDGKPIMSGSKLEDQYEQRYEKIFPSHSRWNVPAAIYSEVKTLFYAQYDPTPFEESLRETFGQATLSQTKTNVMVTAVDAKTTQLVRLSNHTQPTMLVWEAGRSSSAAPLTFSSFEPTSLQPQVRLVDGGLRANNSGWEAFLFARDCAQKAALKFNPIVISFGAGSSPLDPIPESAGIINGLSPTIDVIFNAQSQSTYENLMEKLTLGESLFIFNPQLSRKIRLDEFSLKDRTELRDAALHQLDQLDHMYETVLRPIIERDTDVLAK